MKKIIRIIACFTVCVILSLTTQSFRNVEQVAIPAPNYTVVEILDVPSGYYSLRVDLVGPWYEDETYTITDPFLTTSYPSGTTTINSNEKFFYSEVCDQTSVGVYIKSTSTSDWSRVGGVTTYNNFVTVTSAGNFLQKISFDWDDIPTS